MSDSKPRLSIAPVWPFIEQLRFQIDPDTIDGNSTGTSLKQAADKLGTTTAALRRYRRIGTLPFDAADQFACRLGMHPLNIWGDEWVVA